ncbi:MAG: hypothetical protein ABI456_23940 [Ktedonobacteraceae bacterium]|nr:hypothetical protein [Chloroflexota bacterium]
MPRSFTTQRILREKTAQRYLTALENGDFTTIDAVWQEAGDDSALEQLLFNLHETFPNSQELLASTPDEDTLFQKEMTLLKQEHTQEKEPGSFNASPLSNRPPVRSPRAQQRSWPVLVRTLAAVLLVMFIVGGFLAIHRGNDSRLVAPKLTSTPATTGIPAPSITPKPTQPHFAQVAPLCQVTLPALYQTHTILNDMLVLSNSNIWAVTYFPSQSQMLALHWNGTKWSSVPIPAPAGSGLGKLAALSPSNIWAVGDTGYTNGPGESTPMSHTLIEHWNGTRWSQTPSPDLLPATLNTLQDVSVVAPDDVWAVGAAGLTGRSGYDSTTSPLLEHWDGARWRLVQLPGIHSAGLNSIVALNANDIWVAGSSSVSDGSAQSQSPLLAHWNGQNWSQVSSHAINNGASGRVLKITTDASHHLWALGVDQNGLPLLLRLSNGQWTSLPVPATPAPSATSTFEIQFGGIYAASPQDIWLAGRTVQFSGSGPSTPLIEHWDGHQWLEVAERSQAQATLQAISISAGTVWVSGVVDSSEQPFIATTCR